MRYRTQRQMLPLLGLALALALTFVLAACGSDDDHGSMPHDGPGTPGAGADPDLVFIDAMIVHHQSAIDMAELALEHGEREEIRRLADDIVAAQQHEIDQMREWREEWFPGAPESDLSEMQHMAGMHMTEADMQALREAESFDRAFIEMMIPHHEAAIEMARNLKETTERPELLDLADEIITAQEAEIAQMRAWLNEWYGS
jgi:uncharacterized protein (DUF305 family)